MHEIHPRGSAALRNIRGRLRSQAGAFDLPSILVGVVVVGILAAGVLAAVFGVIPFAQDNAAKQNLDSIRTAEGVAKANLNGYKGKADLVGGGLISDAATIGAVTNAAGSCYVGLSKSATGKVYYSTDKNNEAKLLAADTDTGCVDAATLGDATTSVGGLPTGPVAGGPTPGGPTVTPTAYDFDGDNVLNTFDPSPRGETTQRLAGFGGNWAGELGTTVDTTNPTNSIMQGTIGGQRIGLLSENTGSYHACGTLEATGELYCWGENNNGQLGNGTPSREELPVKVLGLDGKVISQVITNGYGTCAIADNEPFCWGGGNLISSTQNLAPVAVDTGGVLTGKTITKLVGGNQFACVLADGTPYCWGYNNYGQLGYGDTAPHFTPVPVVTSGVLAGKTITDLGAYNRGACAIADGSAFCWGTNDDGELGNGTLVNSSVPTAVIGLGGKTVTSIAGGYDTVCAVASGAAYCWGTRVGTMIGDGQNPSYAYDPDTYQALPSNYAPEPIAVDMTGALAGKTVTHIDMGDSHVCVLASEAPYCWGEGDLGGGYVTAASPIAVGGSLAAGNKTVGLWTTGGSTIFSYIAS